LSASWAFKKLVGQLAFDKLIFRKACRQAALFEGIGQLVNKLGFRKASWPAFGSQLVNK